MGHRMSRQFGLTRRQDVRADNVIAFPPEGRHGLKATARRVLATTPVPSARRAFSFAQLARDVTAVIVWAGYVSLAVVCLLIPAFVFGFVLFLE